METETTKTTPILEMAWQSHADLDLAADQRTRGFRDIRKTIAWLGILATLFAILTQEFFRDLANPTGFFASLPSYTYVSLGISVKVLFIAIPVLASIFAAFASKFYSNGSWLIYRAGAEEIKKEIYLYRTVLPKDKTRRDYLEKRLGEIHRKVFRNLGGEFAFEGYKGPLPSSYNKKSPSSDPGFHDLTGDDYVKYRLKHQLDWHNNKINQRKLERRWMTIYILAFGGLGAILAALPGVFAIWVALTASITAALLGWQELRKVDETIKNYSKVVVELSILYTHWQSLEPEEHTAAEFEKMVLGAERVLWTQNREYIRSMQEALREADLEKDAAFINQVIKESADSAERAKEKMHENIIETYQGFLAETEQKLDATAQTVLATLAEEASSEIVQKELEAMGQAISEKIEDVMDRASSFVSSITQVKEEHPHMEIDKDTTMEDLNTILAKYPKTNEVKG
ncbi:MAG TPA: SLATT domain-containing protein [Anaerolineales bacterium]|nr:SLATT domain-containing protein [Anaerolineales bacterium]